MSAHATFNEHGRATCEALLDALRQHDRSAYCKHAATMCAFGVGSGPNFAYALHRKRTASLDIYFPSSGEDRFEPFGGITPQLRKTLGSGWADRFAWHFTLDDPTSAADAAAFLFRVAGTSDRAREAAPVGTVALQQKPTEGRELHLKDDHDVAMIRRAADLPMKRLHNAMTNALLRLANGRVAVLEGSRPEAQFDALLRHYDAEGHDLLLEVKSSIDIPDMRLAIGQLLDYRRFVERPEETHLGVLMPSRPSDHVLAFADSLNHLCGRPLIALYWFQAPTDLSTVSDIRGPFLPQAGAR